MSSDELTKLDDLLKKYNNKFFGETAYEKRAVNMANDEAGALTNLDKIALNLFYKGILNPRLIQKYQVPKRQKKILAMPFLKEEVLEE